MCLISTLFQTQLKVFDTYVVLLLKNPKYSEYWYELTKEL